MDLGNNIYSNADIVNLFIIHGECQRIVSRTCRVFNERYPNLIPINRRKFRIIMRNQINFGTINANRNIQKPITTEEENIVNVLAYFQAYPEASIRAAEHDLGISRPSIQRILKEHGMHAFKFQLVAALHPGDAAQRVELCEMILLRTQEDPYFLEKIIWTDESKFTKEGTFNKHNSHFWATENPHAIRERNFQYKFSVNVFSLIMHDQVRYHIYEGTLNTERYLEILQMIVSDFLDNVRLDRRDCWYQLDGAPPHCGQQIDEQLNAMFEDRWIRRLGPWNWPPRSPDLTPLDFCLWGTIKQRVYSTPIDSKEELVARIRRTFAELDPGEIARATTNAVMTRIHTCLRVQGGHIEHLL